MPLKQAVWWVSFLAGAVAAMTSHAAPTSTLFVAEPSSTLAQPESRNEFLTPAQIKYIEARMDARSILASGKPLQEAVTGFARHYDHATDLQILGLAALVAGGAVGGLMAKDHPVTAEWAVLGGCGVNLVTTIGSWVEQRRAAEEILGASDAGRPVEDRWKRISVSYGKVLVQPYVLDLDQDARVLLYGHGDSGGAVDISIRDARDQRVTSIRMLLDGAGMGEAVVNGTIGGQQLAPGMYSVIARGAGIEVKTSFSVIHSR